MPEGIIGMEEMAEIFNVTDPLGIHRESVSVELTREDPGSIDRSDAGKIAITIPESGTVQEFCQKLQRELESMGYTPVDLDDEEED